MTQTNKSVGDSREKYFQQSSVSLAALANWKIKFEHISRISDEPVLLHLTNRMAMWKLDAKAKGAICVMRLLFKFLFETNVHKGEDASICLSYKQLDQIRQRRKSFWRDDSQEVILKVSGNSWSRKRIIYQLRRTAWTVAADLRKLLKAKQIFDYLEAIWKRWNQSLMQKTSIPWTASMLYKG